MSTSICKALLGCLCFALTACDVQETSRSAPSFVTLSNGLIIAGARGWCVDQTTSGPQADATVVIFGSCAALTRDAEQPHPSVSGIVTVSVENAVVAAPPLDSVETFLRSEQGRAALSRSGRSDSVEILETEIAGDALVLHAVDRSGVPDGAAEEYWRALFEIDGRVLTVSLVASSEENSNSAAWRAALEEQIARIKSANAA